MWCNPCRAVGMIHCAYPDECGNMLSGKAAADNWKAWLDDLPLDGGFAEGIDQVQDFITGIVARADAAETEAATLRAEVERLLAERAPFFFDRYINGVRMAEGVCIERETTLEGAMQAAARIAAKGPNGEAPVLVYRAPAAQAREAALREAADLCAGIRQRIANGPMPEGARFDYEQAILALIGEART